MYKEKTGYCNANETTNKFRQTEMSIAAQAGETWDAKANALRERPQKINCQKIQQGNILRVALHNGCLDFCVFHWFVCVIKIKRSFRFLFDKII
jgi:hypothetical protein